MTQLYIDGDACPVKAEIARVAERYGLHVVIVSNQGLRTSAHPNVEAVVVGSGFDAADNWIVDHISAGDIAVTSDIPLAARCVDKGAHVLAPNGKSLTPDNIGSVLALRNLNSYLREAGEIKGTNPPFSKQDRSRFLQALDLLIQRHRKKERGA